MEPLTIARAGIVSAKLIKDKLISVIFANNYSQK